MTDASGAASMSQERLRWIETWAKGWHLFTAQRFQTDESYYSQMPMDVASSMILELVAALKDVDTALDLLARVPHESGHEIGELIEERRGSIYRVNA